MKKIKQFEFIVNNKKYIYLDENMIIYEKSNIITNPTKLNIFNFLFLNSINLITNQTCNMRCDYCYAKAVVKVGMDNFEKL